MRTHYTHIHTKNITSAPKLKEPFLNTDLTVQHGELSHNMEEIHTINPVENLKYKKMATV